MTELQATNRILLSAGLPLVTAFDNAPEDAIRARELLRNHTEELVTQDWAFNTLEDVSISKDSEGGLYLPDEYAYASFYPQTEREFSPAVVGRRILSRNGGTLPDPLRLKRVIVKVAWDEIPAAIQFFIIKLAENDFVSSVLGDPSLQQHTQETLGKAWNDLQRYRVRTTPTPLFRVPEVLNRGHYQSSHRPSRMR